MRLGTVDQRKCVFSL